MIMCSPVGIRILRRGRRRVRDHVRIRPDEFLDVGDPAGGVGVPVGDPDVVGRRVDGDAVGVLPIPGYGPSGAAPAAAEEATVFVVEFEGGGVEDEDVVVGGIDRDPRAVFPVVDHVVLKPVRASA